MSTPADQPVRDVGRDSSVAARVEQLYERHAALVRSLCGSLLRDRVEAEDAAQQTFLSAQRALLNGSSPRDAAAWLATIARNECLARIRARMRDPLPVEIEEHGAAPDTHAVAAGRHDAGELRDALADLPAQQREAILLREVRGLSYQEVAATLAVTTSAAESLLFRARRSLQTRLEGALAALSPGEWAVPLRELAARIGAGGLVAPAAAKIGAVGVGTAVLAGGAVMGPSVLGLGHAPSQPKGAARSNVHRAVHAVASRRPPVTFLPIPASHPERHLSAAPAGNRTHAGSGDSGQRIEVSDTHLSSATGDRSSEDRSSGSGSTREAGDGTSGRTSNSGDHSTSGQTGDSSSNSTDDSSTDTTDSSTTSTSTTTTTDTVTTGD